MEILQQDREEHRQNTSASDEYSRSFGSDYIATIEIRHADGSVPELGGQDGRPSGQQHVSFIEPEGRRDDQTHVNGAMRNVPARGVEAARGVENSSNSNSTRTSSSSSSTMA